MDKKEGPSGTDSFELPLQARNTKMWSILFLQLLPGLLCLPVNIKAAILKVGHDI